MAFDEALAERIRGLLAGRKGVEEKRMFGGLAFFFGGHIGVGVWGNSLIARLGADEAEASRRERHVGPFAPAGRPMTGWVLVAPEALGGERLEEWIMLAERFTVGLPAK